MFLKSLTRIIVRDKVYLKEGMNMKKLIRKYGGAILFYSVIVIMIFLVNIRFEQLNEINEEKPVYAYNN